MKVRVKPVTHVHGRWHILHSYSRFKYHSIQTLGNYETSKQSSTINSIKLEYKMNKKMKPVQSCNWLQD